MLSLAARVAISVKNQVRDLFIRLSKELQLSTHEFQEELASRFRKDRESVLIGGPLHELPILERDGDGECRGADPRSRIGRSGSEIAAPSSERFEITHAVMDQQFDKRSGASGSTKILTTVFKRPASAKEGLLCLRAFAIGRASPFAIS